MLNAGKVGHNEDTHPGNNLNARTHIPQMLIHEYDDPQYGYRSMELYHTSQSVTSVHANDVATKSGRTRSMTTDWRDTILLYGWGGNRRDSFSQLRSFHKVQETGPYRTANSAFLAGKSNFNDLHTSVSYFQFRVLHFENLLSFN
jgi:hypothetical protein